MCSSKKKSSYDTYPEDVSGSNKYNDIEASETIF